MSTRIRRRDFVRSGAAATVVASVPGVAGTLFGQAPAVRTGASRPVVIASANGNRYKNGGPVTCVEKAFAMMTQGGDVLDALVAGVNIVELDPADDSVGYGGLPNADGVVQLDSSVMHGPLRRAGAVACLEGVPHALARREGGDGTDRPPPARRPRRADVRAQHGLHDRGRPQQRELAPEVAGLEAPVRPAALPRPRQARARPATRPGCRWCARG